MSNSLPYTFVPHCQKNVSRMLVHMYVWKIRKYSKGELHELWLVHEAAFILLPHDYG